MTPNRSPPRIIVDGPPRTTDPSAEVRRHGRPRRGAPVQEFRHEVGALFGGRRRTTHRDRRDTEERQREFIAQLYEIVSRNRGLIMSYLARVFEPEIATGLEHTPALLNALDRTADATGEHLGRLGKAAGSNTRIGTRAVVGMILAMALFHDFGNPGAAR
jgi:hypothetical protein